MVDVANRKVHLNVLSVCVECDEVVHEVGGGVEIGRWWCGDGAGVGSRRLLQEEK